MSTDDLIQRARDRARVWPMSATSDLVTELTDEVERLRATEGVCTHQNAQYLAMKAERDEARAEADRWKARAVTAGVDLDAARAALERVRAIAESEDHRDDEGNHVDLNATSFYDIRRALGES